MPVGRYLPHPAEDQDYDPHAPVVAELVGRLIQGKQPSLVVEHVGSTAVPGCRGKGVIDLAILYSGDGLSVARDTLDRLGFQRQEGRDPWPETRPMRVGAWTDGARTYRLHAHVVSEGSREHGEMLWFRDRLRSDSDLAQRYQAAKRAILDCGVTDTYDYAIAKGDFVAHELHRWRGGRPAAAAGTVTIGGELVVNRIGFGTMQLPGKGVWGEPADPPRARAVLRRAVALGVNLVDTADYYGPEVANRLVFEALHPYPQDLVIATKVGYRRGPDRSWLPDHEPERIRSAGRLGDSNAPLAQLGAAHGATPVQLALAWLLHRSPIVTPIPGTSSIAHLEENVSAGVVRPPAELVSALDSWRSGAA